MMTEDAPERAGGEPPAEMETDLQVATSDLLAQMSSHIATLTTHPNLNGEHPGPTAAIRQFVEFENLPTTAEDASEEENCRARAGGVLHALVKFEAEYRADLASDGGRDERTGASELLCLQVGRDAADMNFRSPWRTLRNSETDLAKDGGLPAYWDGVLNTLRTQLRSVEISLEQLVLRQIDSLDAEASFAEMDQSPRDDTRTKRQELSTLVFVALTSASRQRMQRALGNVYDDGLLTGLVDRGLLSEDEHRPTLHINPEGADRARSLMIDVS